MIFVGHGRRNATTIREQNLRERVLWNSAWHRLMMGLIWGIVQKRERRRNCSYPQLTKSDLNLLCFHLSYFVDHKLLRSFQFQLKSRGFIHPCANVRSINCLQIKVPTLNLTIKIELYYRREFLFYHLTHLFQ